MEAIIKMKRLIKDKYQTFCNQCNSFLGKDANDKGRLICLAVDIVLYRIGFTEDCSIKGVFGRMKFVQKSTAAVRRTISAFFLCLITEKILVNEVNSPLNELNRLINKVNCLSKYVWKCFYYEKIKHSIISSKKKQICKSGKTWYLHNQFKHDNNGTHKMLLMIGMPIKNKINLKKEKWFFDYTWTRRLRVLQSQLLWSYTCTSDWRTETVTQIL